MHYRNILALLHDIGAATLAWCLSYWLRFNMDIPSNFVQGMLFTLPVVIPIQTVILWKFGLYRGIWRYASVSDLKRILYATLIAALTVVAVIVMMSWQEKVPRSVLILDPLLLAVIMGGSRFTYRAWREHTLYGGSQSRGKPVLVLGAGDAAVSLLKETRRSEEWRIVGLLDDDPHKMGRVIDGVRVLGRLDQIAQFAKPLQVRYAIVALPSAAAPTRRRAVEAATNAGLQLLTVPSFDDLLSGKVTVSQLRRVELDDLLGREAVTLDNAGLAHLLSDHTVMVTGAGGSIGSELCRQIARFKPRQLVLFELNEFALYRMEQEFHEQLPEIHVICAIGDVKNPVRLQQIFDTYRPTVVFHAAAYKHVPLMEQANAAQAVLNNALGTYRLAQAAIAAGIEKFVLISTDKAVNPTNVMGASKRLAELICQMLQRKSRTQFVIVRFGNVLGSTGSVIPKFRQQLARGGPITVTHPEITRYFMSISEAAQLVLQAGLMGEGGNIFVLEMGEPVKIVDLALDLIRLSGLSKDDIKIVYTGLRPGEKLYEELLADDEHTLPTPHPKLRIAKPKAAIPDQLEAIVTWLEQSEAHPEETVRSGLRIWVPEYANGGQTASLPEPCRTS